MAKKKAEKQMPASAEPKLKPVRLDLSEEGHRLLRVLSSIDDTNMAAMAKDIVEKFVRAETKRRGLNI
jgi:hypothetical protein